MKTVKISIITLAFLASASVGIAQAMDHGGGMRAMRTLKPDERTVFMTLSSDGKNGFLELSAAERAEFVKAAPTDRADKWPHITPKVPARQAARQAAVSTGVGGPIHKPGSYGNRGYTPGVRGVQTPSAAAAAVAPVASATVVSSASRRVTPDKIEALRAEVASLKAELKEKLTSLTPAERTALESKLNAKIKELRGKFATQDTFPRLGRRGPLAD